jgi:hypothetical protein
MSGFCQHVSDPSRSTLEPFSGTDDAHVQRYAGMMWYMDHPFRLLHV